MSMLFLRSVLFAVLIPFAAPGASLPVVLQKTGPVTTETIRLSGLDTRHSYSLLYSVQSLRALLSSTLGS